MSVIDYVGPPVFITMIFIFIVLLLWYSIKENEEKEQRIYDCETRGNVLEREIHLKKHRYLIEYYVEDKQYLIDYVERSSNIKISDYIDKSHNNIIIKYCKAEPKKCVIKGYYKYSVMKLLRAGIVMTILGVIRCNSWDSICN